MIAGQSGATQSAVFSNDGDSELTFTNISYSLVSETGPWIAPNATGNGSIALSYFTLSGVPDSIPGNSQAVVSITYEPTEIGLHSVFIQAYSNGGNAGLDIIGKAASQPLVLYEFEKPDGSGWTKYVPGIPFTFGNVTEGTTRELHFRVTNNGSASAAALSLTVSKPPFGVPGIVGAANNVDLAEGTTLAPGESETAVLFCAVPKRQVNLPSYSGNATWTINTNTGDDSGKQTIVFSCNAVSEQLGPLLANGSAQFPYIGCFKENNPGRQLAVQVDASDDNENDRCITACYNRGYVFAGTQYRRECWCGNALPSEKDLERDCNFPCAGNVNQTCGGDGYFHDSVEISLFADSTLFDGNTTTSPVGIVQSTGNYNYAGCYAENGAKTFNAKTTADNAMTVDACRSFCAPSTYFGVQYGSECYCGQTLASTSKKTADSECSMSCSGNNRQYCGAGNRMQVYVLNGTSTRTSSGTASASASQIPTSSGQGAGPTAPAGWKSLGCYSEAPGRALQAKAKADSSVTNEVCASFCAGYKYFATEYANECYCGNTLVADAQSVTDGRCNMACVADNNQICGGPNGLSLYQANSSASSTTSPSAAVTSSSLSSGSPATTSTKPGGPTVVPRASGYVSIGCYSEKPNDRALANIYANDSMTIEMCAAQALQGPYKYMGVEYGRECWYGNVLAAEAQPIAQSQCSFQCPGDKSEYCGAGNALQLYNLTAAAANTANSQQSPKPTSSRTGSAAAAPSDARSTPGSTGTSMTVSSQTSSRTSSRPTSTTSSATPSATPLACPSSNGTVYQTQNATTTFNFIVECFLDHAGGDMRGAGKYVASLEDCVGQVSALQEPTRIRRRTDDMRDSAPTPQAARISRGSRRSHRELATGKTTSGRIRRTVSLCTSRNHAVGSVLMFLLCCDRWCVGRETTEHDQHQVMSASGPS